MRKLNTWSHNSRRVMTPWKIKFAVGLIWMSFGVWGEGWGWGGGESGEELEFR